MQNYKIPVKEQSQSAFSFTGNLAEECQMVNNQSILN